MKNTLFIIAMAALMVACSPADDDQETLEVVPSSPANLKVRQTTQTAVSLNWRDNSDNEDGFYIERKTGNENYKRIGTIGNNTVLFTDSGLLTSTTYSYRVIAYNTTGISASYSNEKSVNLYVYIQVGTSLWMQQNLDVERYRNGDVIPQVTSPTAWANLTTGAWCYYANNTANGVVYGKLYNWYAVNDSRGLAPQGWHVATSAEWTALTTELGGINLAGAPLKSTEHWTSPNTGATNSSGFTALGGGARVANGTFNNLGAWGAWWTSTNDTEGISFYRILYSDNTKSEVYHNVNTLGLSVRCVKD